MSKRTRKLFERQVLTALDNSIEDAENALNKVLYNENRTEAQQVVALNTHYRTVAAYSKLARIIHETRLLSG